MTKERRIVLSRERKAIMGKVDTNKKQKRDSLLDAAFRLFMKNGFYKTSISDIVAKAGVAKGTFYLYFTDKDDIRNHLISFKANQVFRAAYRDLLKESIDEFEDQVIFIIDHILNQFCEDKSLVLFLSKHLSWGFFKDALIAPGDDESLTIFDIYQRLLVRSKRTFRNPEVMIFMILELVSGTSYHTILYNQPMSIDEFKPYLYRSVRNILREETLPDNESVTH